MRGETMPSISPAASIRLSVAPAGAASSRMAGGRSTAIFSGRPGSSSPPRTQIASEG